MKLDCKNCPHKKSDHYTVVENPQINKKEARGGSCKSCDCDKFKPKYTKKYVNEIYQKFLELHSSTKLQAQDVGPSGKYNSQTVNLDDNKKLQKIEKELKKCLNFLNEDQLINLISQKGLNSNFEKVIHKELKKRKLN